MDTSYHIQVGYGRTDIMPEGSVELGGYGNGPFRKSEEIADVLFATCIAITDEADKTILLITMDLLHAMAGMVADMRRLITEATGIPGEHIMIAATHNHNGPDIYNPGPQTVKDYIKRCVERVPRAALAALEDRKPATILAGKGQLENMTFVRHYKMADGTVAGSNFGSWKSGIVDHTAQADQQLQLIRFVRQEGKDILLMNWQAHVDMLGGTSKTLSADYVGAARTYLELTTGCHFAFFLGACGNLNPTSRIPGEGLARDKDRYGKRLGDAALEMLKHLTPIAAGPVRTCRRQVACTVDHSTDHMVDTARELWALFLSGKDPQQVRRRVNELHFNSPYTARTLVERSQMPATMDQEMNALCVGELAFATAPYEMFCQSGQHVKENSPFAMTFMLSCCNASNSYLATRQAFGHGCYEVDTRKFAEGSAEMLADNLVEMLKQIKQ